MIHQLWLFVTGSSNTIQINFSWVSLTYFHPVTVVSYHPAAPAQAGSQLDVDLNAALMANIPGLTSQNAKDTYSTMDAYIMAACLARQACLLQLQGPMVKNTSGPFPGGKGRRFGSYAHIYPLFKCLMSAFSLANELMPTSHSRIQFPEAKPATKLFTTGDTVKCNCSSRLS